MAIGVTVMAIWLLGLEGVGQLRPRHSDMKFNTGLAFVLEGAALLAWSLERRTATRALGAVVALIGLATLLQYVLGIDLQIDRLLVPDAGSANAPGRMSPPSALAHLLLGAAFLSSRTSWRGTLLGLTALVATFAMYGYLFGTSILYGARPGISGMALPTVLGFLMLATSGILLVGRQYPFDLLYGHGPGQIIARRAGVAALVVPAVMALIARRAEAVDLWGNALEDAVLALGLSLVLLAVVHSTSRATHVAAREALEARDALANANERLEATVERRTAELQEINAELERFVSVVSHDIREPLLVLQMAARRLGRDLEDASPGVQRRIEDIQWAVRNATDLVSSMLEWTRNMGQPIHLEPVDMEQYLEDALRDLQARIEERQALITTQPLPIVQGSSGLKQVLQNLIGNAIKYGAERPEVDVRAEPHSDHWKILVTDNGQGVPLEHAVEIFEPYKRLPGTTQEGIGLGLALVRRIVQAHGGTVGVESPPGQGSTFWFTVPRPAEEAPA